MARQADSGLRAELAAVSGAQAMAQRRSPGHQSPRAGVPTPRLPDPGANLISGAIPASAGATYCDDLMGSAALHGQLPGARHCTDDMALACAARGAGGGRAGEGTMWGVATEIDSLGTIPEEAGQSTQWGDRAHSGETGHTVGTEHTVGRQGSQWGDRAHSGGTGHTVGGQGTMVTAHRTGHSMGIEHTVE